MYERGLLFMASQRHLVRVQHGWLYLILRTFTGRKGFERGGISCGLTGN